MTDETTPTGTQFAFGQLQQALHAATNPSGKLDEVSPRVQRWRSVLEGILGGSLQVGSRTPVAGVPAWATLEVVTGGFATGSLLAEGPLAPYELQLLEELDLVDAPASARAKLNAYFLADAGRARLLAALELGTYRIELPEDGLLLVVAWLVREQKASAVLGLLSEIEPYFERLRFYPTLTERPQASGQCIRVQSVAQTVAALEKRQANLRVQTMNETLAIWNPLYDRLVELWMMMVEGEAPNFRRDAGNARELGTQGQPVMVGGQIVIAFTEPWLALRQRWLADYAACKQHHRLSKKHLHRKSNFAVLAGLLEQCSPDQAVLTPSQCSRIRHAIASTHAARGVVGSSTRSQLREVQRKQSQLPLHQDITGVLVQRLRCYPLDGGVAQPDVLLQPLADNELDATAAGTEIPSYLRTKALRAAELPLPELIERGIVHSGEMIAGVVPQLTRQIAALGFADAQLRELYGQLYAAFRRRRSLLLLNLSSQVDFAELPWVSALLPWQKLGEESASAARATMCELTKVTLQAFPQTILPNPLVKEFSALAKQAELKIPLVEEIAADIFMGTFVEKFGIAANIAEEMLRGTVYARYYELHASSVEPRSRIFAWGKRVDNHFATRCTVAAEKAGHRLAGIAKNGAILEQSQIATTHNLAVLVGALELRQFFAQNAASIVERVATWMVQSQLQLASHAHGRLRLHKNLAYAWRQLLFFFSLEEASHQERMLQAIEAIFAAGPKEVANRLAPLAAGLRAVFQGAKFDSNGVATDGSGGRRLYGWCAGSPWLFPLT